jgi:hypothetical protein
MNTVTLIATCSAAAVAVAYGFFTRREWRSQRPVFARFPTTVTAVLAAGVAVRGCVELLAWS